MPEAPPLSRLLEEHRAALRRFVERGGRRLLRYESADDLVQGVHLRVIAVAGHFEYRGEAEVLSWLQGIARQHLADRHRYWTALRRDAGTLLRITDAPSGSHPAATTAGPVTRAARRELVALATRALAVLLPRDQELVRWITEGLSIREVAARRGVSYDAAERSRLRAVERFRKAYVLVSRSGRGIEAGPKDAPA